MTTTILKFCLINISKKNINISTKFIPYFKISNSDDIRQLHYFIILIIMLVIEYKIYNKDFKNFIDNIDDSQLCIGVYIRFYDIIDNNYKKENDIYFEWAIKDWKNIKKLRYFESPLFISNNDKWAIIIKEGKIHIKCYSFSLDEDYYHVKSIIRIRCSDDFSEGLLLEENKFFNKESEITFSEKLKNIKTKNKIDNIEKINETDTIVISVYIVEYLNIEENHINKLKNILLKDDLENKKLY
ncbi:hypothetical protein LY90DRAFT_513462 [Neocallimastix californiae]|uniref:Uncharacterized protein n=1 Tax=Neocallimastix californiae TaxID=1754190 RepID=A0A1Y2AY48_9FUNG|nr:hypothetical protein LY90DRAFT_513462 [Neocallimastix californiae]|eukprot:ORY27416.1 hypothetical protein LY90DRAFT_513462 [Neocallimastix californiae]